MPINKRRLYWSLVALIALGLMSVSALLLADAALNRPATIRKISALASHHLGGPVHFTAIRASLFPTPHINLTGIRGYLPGKIGATARDVAAYPSLKGLITGGVPIGALRIHNPVIYVELPKKHAAPPGTAPADPSAAMSAAVAAIIDIAPDLEVTVEGGRLIITADTASGVTLENLNARLSIPDGSLEADCSATAWKRVQLSLQLDTPTLDISGKIQFNGLNLAEIATMFPGFMPATTGETDASLELNFSGNNARIATAAASLTLPTLNMPLPDGALSLGGIRIDGDYIDGPDARTIHLTTLSLARPRIDARGSFTFAKAPGTDRPRHQISVTADTVDLTGIRSALDAALGRRAVVEKILGIVRGGRATDVSFTVSGDTPGALGVFKNMTISGQAENAVIHVPGIDLELTDAAGRFLIRNGVLRCEAATARTGQSRGSDGTLQLGLTGDDDVFSLNVAVALDLIDLPPVLTRVLKEKDRQWLAAVSDVSGKAAGILKLGERRSDLHVTVDVDRIEGTAGIEGLPYPVAVSSGKATVTEKALSVVDASAAMGKSTVTGLSVTLPFSDSAPRIRAARITLAGAEIYPWLRLKPEFAAMQGAVGTVSGALVMDGLDWAGAFDRPMDGLKTLVVSTDAMTFTGGVLPETVTLGCRQLRIAPGNATISGADLRMSDAHLAFSGALVRDTGGLSQVDIHVSGDIGDSVFKHLVDAGSLPPQMIINPPLNVTDLRVGWRRAQQTMITGNLRMGGGPLISIDAALAQEDVNIRTLRITDSVSDSLFTFHYRKMAVEAGFTGRLHRSTVDRLLADNSVLLGSLEGKATLRLPLENPAGFEMEGHLQAEGLHFPDWQGAPLQVHTLDIGSRGRHIDIDTIDMSLLGSHLTAAGKADIAPDELQLAIGVAADQLDVTHWIDALKTLSGDEGSSPSDASADKRPRRKINAAIDLSVGAVTAGKLRWAPVTASMTMTPGSVNMVFTRADICGIALPGRMSFSAGNISAAFAPSATGQDLNATLNCLHERPVDLTGTFDLKGTVSADGPRDALALVLTGDISVRTSSGRIYQAESLENIFSMLNLPGLLDSKQGSAKEGGLAYDIISADIAIDSGVVTVEKGAMKGPLMQLAFQGAVGIEDQALDITVFVVPLKSIVSVASKIPFIGRIISGNLISIPVKISGTMKAPRYIPLAPSAVGQQAARIMKDIIRLPVDIFQPIIPESQTESAPGPSGK